MMIKKTVGRLLWILLAAALISFAIYNRHRVDVMLPFTEYQLSLSVFWLVFVGIFLGVFLAGSISSWFRLKGFVDKRKAEREAGVLRAQMSAMSEDAAKEQARQAHKNIQNV